MHNYDYAEFSRKRKKEGRKFSPTDEQIKTAKARIIGVFSKNHGWIYAMGEKELVVTLCREVFNRGRELGDYRRGEFRQTITRALQDLLCDGLVKFSEDDQSFGLTMVSVAKPRTHKQKYPRGRLHRAA